MTITGSDMQAMEFDDHEPEDGSLRHGFVSRECPVDVDLWRVVIQVPEQPSKSVGGIELPEEYRDRKEFSSYIGRVAGMGPLCFQAKTRTGLDLTEAKQFKVGDWVMFGKHGGEKFRTTDGMLWIVMSETDVIGKVENPDVWDCMRM